MNLKNGHLPWLQDLLKISLTLPKVAEILSTRKAQNPTQKSGTRAKLNPNPYKKEIKNLYTHGKQMGKVTSPLRLPTKKKFREGVVVHESSQKRGKRGR